MRGDHRILGAALLAGSLVTATGCAHRKISECNALITVINDGVVSLEKTPKADADPSGLADLQAMAAAMERIASEAAAVTLTIPEVKQLSAEYQKMARDIARAEREIAAAAKTSDTAKRFAAEQSLDTAVKREDPLVDAINKACQAP